VRAAGDENLGETREVWGAEHVADEAGEVGVCCAGVEGEGGDCGNGLGLGLRRSVRLRLGLGLRLCLQLCLGLGYGLGLH
jgi:hypothetical protein